MDKGPHLYHGMSKLGGTRHDSTKPVWEQGQMQGEKKEYAALQLSWQSISSFITSIPLFFLLTFLLLPPPTLWHLKAKIQSLFICCNISINVSLLPYKNTFHNNYHVNMQTRRLGWWCCCYFLSHPDSISPLLKKLAMRNLATEGWKRVAGCEHLIWIISSSRLQFSLPSQMDWDLLWQRWISMGLLPLSASVCSMLPLAASVCSVMPPIYVKAHISSAVLSVWLLHIH